MPLSFYAVTKFLSKDVIVLPRYFSVDRVDSQLVGGKMKYDSIYHQVADVMLTNQLGQQVWLNKDLKGKNVVINFFFSTCPTICPRLTGHIASMLVPAFKKTQMKDNDTLVQFISISVNPERDSFPVLRSYAERFNVNHDTWWFLTGDKKTIYDYARNELRLSVGPGDGGAEDFIHSEKLVLLDKDRNIRGYYNGLDTAEVLKCANDVGLLVMEKKRKKK